MTISGAATLLRQIAERVERRRFAGDRAHLRAGVGQALAQPRRLERRLRDDQRAPADELAERRRPAGRGAGVRQRDREGEDRAAARRRIETQRSAHGGDEPAGDGESEPGAAERADIVALFEFRENRLALRQRHAGSGVDDAEAQTSGSVAQSPARRRRLSR
jgi:hypothetical protein